MTVAKLPSCRVVRPGGEVYDGKQGFRYLAGISAETTGSLGICMHLLTIWPGDRGRAHMHADHETAIYAIAGESAMWYGPALEHHLLLKAGEMLYIPAGMPHLPANQTSRPATVVIARTDPNEQESIVLLPELEALAPAA